MNYITKTLDSLTKSKKNENPDNFSINNNKEKSLSKSPSILKSFSIPQSSSKQKSLSKQESLSKPQSITKKNIETPILSAATISPELNKKFSSINESPKIAVSQSKTIFFAILFTILAFIGYNIFTYLSDGTSYIIDLLKPIFSSVSLLTGDTLKTTIDNTLSGTNKSIDITSNTTKNILNNATLGSKETINKLQDKSEISTTHDINDESDSENDLESTQNPKSINTTENSNSFCYIGKINNTRYCAKVLDDKYCLSEEIFPTMDLCINPKLRN